MYIYNKANSIKIVVDENSEYAGKEFMIYKISPEGCILKTAVYTGNLDGNNSAEIKLKDGKYIFSIQEIINLEEDPEDTDIKYLTQEFIVFYNFLPYLTDTIIKSLCNSAPCNNCDDKDEDKVLLERYYQISMYLNCTGLYNKLPVLKSFVCDQTNMLIDRCEYIRYYGKFIFDYSDNIKKYFAYLYANLYKATILNIKDDLESEIEKMNTLFNINTIERCLYRLGIDFNDIICKLDQINCNCNE